MTPLSSTASGLPSPRCLRRHRCPAAFEAPAHDAMARATQPMTSHSAGAGHFCATDDDIKPPARPLPDTMSDDAQMTERPGGGSALPLPRAAEHDIFMLLSPVDRGRACCVSRAWRDTVSDPSLWTRLVLATAQTGPPADAVLRGAASKALSGLEVLDVSGALVTKKAFNDVFRAHARSLRMARLVKGQEPLWLPSDYLVQLLEAAPLLREFHADVFCHTNVIQTLLEGPFGPLRVRSLRAHALSNGSGSKTIPASFLACCARHPLEELHFLCMHLNEARDFEALVEMVVSKQMACLQLRHCCLPRDFASTLQRALGPDAALRQLRIESCWCGEVDEAQFGRSLDSGTASQLASALAACPRLKHIAIIEHGMWRRGDVMAPLLNALSGHPSLTRLEIFVETPCVIPPHKHAGVALGALVAANAPSLQELVLHSDSEDFESSLEPLFGALRCNTHLRELHMSNMRFSAECVLRTVIPCVSANGSLHKLALHPRARLMEVTRGPMDALFAQINARAETARHAA